MIRTIDIQERETLNGIEYRLEIRDDDSAVVYVNDNYTAYVIYDESDNSYLIVTSYAPHHYVARDDAELYYLLDNIVETVAAE